MRSLAIKKRAIVAAGLKTSISLEDEFWESLNEIGLERGKTRTQLITEIGADRKGAHLSSAIRMYILRYYRSQVEKQKDEIASSGCSRSVEHGVH
jgi:predicted DNA-binding ribbon-helix-helix protein